MSGPEGSDGSGGIGIFGGTFDPVHHGHLIVADAVAETLDLQRLLLVPARRSPFKPRRRMSSGEHRLRMLELGTEGHPRLEASALELQREPPSYTVDTLRALRALRDELADPPQLHLVLGADSLGDFASWRQPESILAMARLVVVGRPGHDLERAIARAAGELPDLRQRLTIVDAPRIEIAATSLRRRVGAGRSIRYRVPVTVADYIDAHGLYVGGQGDGDGAPQGASPGATPEKHQVAAHASGGGRLLLATTNAGKVRELRALLGAALPELTLVTPTDLGLTLDVAETGASFAENAALKARAWAQATGLPALADDSGLEVDAQDGAPGVASARWVPGSDRDRMEALLQRLRDVPAERRGARYRAAAALAWPGEAALEIAEGAVEGRIAPTPRGEGGFGYDPIFLVTDGAHDGRRTMAELTADEKNALSHRARAVAGLLGALEQRALDRA